MTERKIERKVYDIMWDAADGTTFSNKEECEKYERSAHAVVRTKFLKLIVEERTEWGFFKAGSDENPVYAIKMDSQEDADTVLQLYYMDNSYILKDDEEQEHRSNMVYTAYKEHDILFVGENYDGEIYLINTRNGIIKDLQDIDKAKEEVKDAK